MPVLSPLIRVRPWISDNVFIAHESLPLFHRIAQVLPSNGWWRLTSTGAESLPGRAFPDLDAEIRARAVASVPCRVDMAPREAFPTRDAAMTTTEPAAVDVITDAGTLARVDQRYLDSAYMDLRWQLDDTPGCPVVVGFDHKDRPRFAVACLTEEPDGSYVQ